MNFLSSIFFRLNAAIETAFRRLNNDTGQEDKKTENTLKKFLCFLSDHAFTGYCCLTFLRFIAMSVAMRFPFIPFYFNFDHLYVYMSDTFDANLIFFNSGLFVVFAYLYDAVHRRPNPFFWTLVHDILTSTFKRFISLNTDRTSFKMCTLSKLQRKLRAHYQVISFNLPKIAHFPNLTPCGRVKLNFLLLIINLLNGMTFVFCFIVASACVLYYWWLIYRQEGATSLYLLFELFDLPAMAYVHVFGFECGVFNVDFYPLLAFTFRQSTGQMLLRLKRQLNIRKHDDNILNNEDGANTSPKNRLLWRQISLAFEWSHFQKQHNMLARYVMTISREVTSPGFFVVFVTGIGFNVYALTTLLIGKKQMSTINKIICFVELLAQSATFFFAFVFCIRITDSLHTRFTGSLIRLQMRLQGDRFAAKKLKIAALYERLQSKRKIGFSVGPFASVTWKVVFRLGLN